MRTFKFVYLQDDLSVTLWNIIDWGPICSSKIGNGKWINILRLLKVSIMTSKPVLHPLSFDNPDPNPSLEYSRSDPQTEIR